MIANPYSGKLIHFEGIDASGKSGQLTRLKNYLQAFQKAQFRKTHFTKEPDIGHPSGVEICQILHGKHPNPAINTANLHPFEMQSRYFRNRVWHYPVEVVSYLAKEFNVVSDRGLASMCFGVSSPAEFKPLMGIQEQFFLGAGVPFIWPDLIIIYDVSAEEASKRMQEQGKEKDDFEKDLEFQMRVRENYLWFAKQYPNCHVIDGSGQPEEIFVKTKEILVPILGLSV